jgi:hypothetical protein
VPPPRYPIEVWPIYFPPVDECEWIEVPAPVYDYDDGDRLREVETASLLLSGATMVWNGVFINAGEPNELVATAGFFTGLSSLALGFSGRAEQPVLHVLFGTASIAFSVLNLSGALDRPDGYEDTYYYDDTYYNSANMVSYSYSF